MTNIIRITFASIGSMLFAVFGALGLWHLSTITCLAQSNPLDPHFAGSILAASDADMIATAYANGKMNKVTGVEDSLAFISFSDTQSLVSSQIHTSNSVVSWPSILAWNQEKQYAYVAETRGVYRGGEQKLGNVWKDLDPGRRISIINYQNAQHPAVVQENAIGENIQGVSLNYNNTLLVAGSTEKGKEIIVARLQDGLIDKAYYFSNDEIDNVEQNNAGILTIEFHPTKNYFAANLNNTHLAFYKVNDNHDSVTIEQLGAPIAVGKHWSVGNWHPSGTFFIITDVAWGKGNLGAIFNKKGKLVSTKFDPAGGHKIVSTAKVGLSPEGFDISPDGKFAIVANMRRTYGPKAFWFVPARKNASLSLVKIDPITGQLETLGKQYGFVGALPEDAIFDQESNTIAVAVYHEQDEEYPKEGWIDFWELREDQLIKTSQRVYLTRGIHNLLLIGDQ
ncbi:MAG: hypothetical protein AAF705_17300 [Bacteroidota bacterium]